MNRRSVMRTIVVLSYGDSLVAKDVDYGDAFFAAKAIRAGERDELAINYLVAIADSNEKKGYRLIGCEDTLTIWNGELAERLAPRPHHIERLTLCDWMDWDRIEFIKDTIRWIRRDDMPLADSINRYILVDSAACRHIYSLAAQIDLDRLDADFLLQTASPAWLTETWTLEYDGGKVKKMRSGIGPGAYSLYVLYSAINTFKRQTLPWRLLGPAAKVNCDCDLRP